MRDARAARMVMRWRTGFLKSGKSGERFSFYSRAMTFAQFDAMTTEFYLPGITGTWRLKAPQKDLVVDTARWVVTFHDADTPLAPGPAVAANLVEAGDDFRGRCR